MLYAYRSGRNRITPKAWHKLSAAEIKAGITHEAESKVAKIVGSVSDIDNNEAAESEKTTKDEVSDRIAAIENQVRILSAAVASLLPSSPISDTAKATPSKKAGEWLKVAEDTSPYDSK